LDDEAEEGKIIALQSLSNAQLIQILQHHDGNDDLEPEWSKKSLSDAKRKGRRNDQGRSRSLGRGRPGEE
jgi:hypothetical protein